jgi:stage II sporulation protein D
MRPGQAASWASAVTAALAVATLAARATSASSPELLVWTLRAGDLIAPPTAPYSTVHVGSLQKPFVVRAWAASHPDELPPRVTCDASSGCWLRQGHGTLGLTRAMAVSCNTYFRTLAKATPPQALRRALEMAGFSVAGSLTADEAIGLPPAPGVRPAVTIEPAALLRAYVTLVREPWPEREPVRRLVVQGLRSSARDGTARGVRRPGWAKTGTTRALDGRPLATSGLVVVVDEEGTGTLGIMGRGTGREAAVALGRGAGAASIEAPRISGAPGTKVVRIRLFSTVSIQEARVRNLGPSPAMWSGGWIGPGATVRLDAGCHLQSGRWEIQIPALRLVRRLEGALECVRLEGNVLRIVAEVPLRTYVAGVQAAEIRRGDPELCDALAAAVVRFLGDGPRHHDADVCDSTHCAWFVGDGPIPEWPDPNRPRLLAGPTPGGCGPIDDHRWASILVSAAAAGPHHWTSHCGGHPLSPHYVWGNGVLQVTPCPRHRTGPERPWSRIWDARSLAQVFGAPVAGMDITQDDGVWVLRVHIAGQAEPLQVRYDEAHRILARVFGWAGLPSPADGVDPATDGFVARGVGLGHRVGLCLGESSW